MNYILEMKGRNILAKRVNEVLYEKFDDKESAVSFFKDFVKEQPGIFDFKLYQSIEVEGLPYDFQDTEKKRRDAEDDEHLKRMSLLRKGSYFTERVKVE